MDLPKKSLETVDGQNQWVIGATFLLILNALGLLISGPGTRWGWWHFSTGFTILRWSVYGAGLTALVSLVGMWRSWNNSESTNLGLAVTVFVCSLGLILIPVNWYLTATSVPPIHDISTDLENPPSFDAVVPIREESENLIEYGGESVAEQQRNAYPDVQSLTVPQPKHRVFETVRSIALDMGWTIHRANPDQGRLEATDETYWFGFKDDIVVRLSSKNSETIVDVRSQSRIGKSDVGTNARRIKKFLKLLSKRLN